MTTLSGRRAQVLTLRVRIERLAASAFDAACRPTTPGRQSDVRARLLFAVTADDPDERARQRRLVELARFVYRRTSDVMHGRVRSLEVSDAMVDEWLAVVEDLERTLDATPGGEVRQLDAAVERPVAGSQRGTDVGEGST